MTTYPQPVSGQRGHWGSAAIFRGQRSGQLCDVTISGHHLPLIIENGINTLTISWGHDGLGAADLALSILDQVIGGPFVVKVRNGPGYVGSVAYALHRQFAADVIARLAGDEWEISVGAVLDWLADQAGAACAICDLPGVAIAHCAVCQRAICRDDFEVYTGQGGKVAPTCPGCAASRLHPPARYWPE